MTLKELLSGFVTCADERVIAGLSLDSRTIAEGQAFIALAGSNQHGLIHAEQAVARGAVAVIYDPQNTETVDLSYEKLKAVPLIAVANLASHLGEIAARFYGNPSRALDVIGITGTNGKTSCSQFLGQALDACGIIGTLGWGEWSNTAQTLNTTPDALAVQKILAELLKSGKQKVAMEVSSHGLQQGRVKGVHFRGAVFTNISRDHLDYHGTMDAYFQAKLALFLAPDLEFAVLNLDDPYARQIEAALPETVKRWGFSVQGNTLASGETVQAQAIKPTLEGLEFDSLWRSQRTQVKAPLYGAFNAVNVLTVLTVMLALGGSMESAAARLASLKPVVGRMERFGAASEPMIFVDYAHTPDALENVLSSLKNHCRNAIWVVFGCGGNRDAGKRPLMGACAERRADHVIITDDNPRFEESQTIVNDILAGCLSSKISVIQNREQAIKTALTKAAANDCVLIAGKGHEDYQEIKGVRYPFSDSHMVMAALKMRAGNL
jgi:UDP-N-acetylmuramoyl-L-alanyl-D-glutamate--2,6-diaminopimelate ligase